MNSGSFPGRPELVKLTGKSDEELQPMLEELVESGVIREFRSGSQKVYIHKGYYSRLLSSADVLLREFHCRYPLRGGMPAEEFRSRLFGNRKGGFTDEVLRSMEQEGAINGTPRVVHLSGFEIELTPEQRDIRSYILDLLEGEGYSPRNK